MGGFAAPVHSDLQPAPAPVAAARTPEIDAPGLVDRLEMSRAFLGDRAFAKLLRDNDLQLAEQLGRFGWRGSWVDDADYVADFESVAPKVRSTGDLSRKRPVLTSGMGRVPSIAGDPKASSTSPVSADQPQSAAAHAPAATAAEPASPAPTQRFTNIFPEHQIDPPLQLFKPAQLLKMAGRKLNYVVTEDGGLTIGRITRTATGGGHIDLAAGKPVLAAGEVKIVDGRIKYFDNSSGHYLPEGKVARDAALKAFRAAGLDVDDNAYIEKVWDTAVSKWVPKPPDSAVSANSRAAVENLSLQPAVTSAEAGTHPALPEIASRGGGVGATAMAAFGAASTLAAVGHTLDLLRQGKPVEAAKTAGIAIAVAKLLKRFPKLGPLGLAIGTLLGYDEQAEDLAMRGGSWVEEGLAKHIPNSVAHVTGGVAASGTALAAGVYRGVVKPVGSGLYAGATILKPTHASFPSLGPGSSRFKARIDTHNEGCQTCHDAVRVDNWAKEHPEMTRLLNGPGSIGGIPTDELLKVFEANAFPLNERLP